MAKLTYLKVSLFKRFPMYKDKNGVLTLKVQNYNEFVDFIKNKTGGYEWLFSHVKNYFINQYGVSIKLNYVIGVK